MGVAEQAGKTISTVAESLKSSPLALSLVIVNLLFLGFITYIAHNVATTHRTERENDRKMIQQLLTECVVKK